MSQRLTQLIALWFVIQIAVPFTAPLQTLDLQDLLGGRTPASAHSAPESSTTPTIRDSASSISLAPLLVFKAQAVSSNAPADAIESAPLESRHRPPPTLRLRRSILRV